MLPKVVANVHDPALMAGIEPWLDHVPSMVAQTQYGLLHFATSDATAIRSAFLPVNCSHRCTITSQ